MASLGMVPIAGLLIDRVNRRTLMLTANGWLFVITLVLRLALLFSQAHTSYLFIFSFLGGMAMALDMPIRQVVVSDLVPPSYTPSAMALVQTGRRQLPFSNWGVCPYRNHHYADSISAREVRWGYKPPDSEH